MNGYIYKITNDVNGKMYIGLCATSIQQRFQTHCQDRKTYKDRPLYRAMNKYGIEHFHIEVIEECLLDDLAERERYWIAFYDTYKTGYNATFGGEGRLLYDHQLIYEKLLENPYPSVVAKEIGCGVDIVRDIARAKGIAVKNLGTENFKTNFSKTVLAFDKKTNEYIGEFESTAEAARWCFEQGLCPTLHSGVRSHISDTANGKRKSAYGHIWKYKEQ